MGRNQSMNHNTLNEGKILLPSAGVDPSDWPDVGSQPLSLEDSGRLRVVSARVYSIVKNRDKEHFERAVSFLEDTHRLLPTLVSPIKHMKVVFGLKTMVHVPLRSPQSFQTIFIEPSRVRHVAPPT